jgi:ADP-ribose pyrophosphatase YjhB (NUDIX family)
MKNNILSISGAIVFKDRGKKRRFLLVKQQEEEKWEIPKITVRKGESSVRASLRMTSEMAGMNTKIIEEAGRSAGTVIVNRKTIPQKTYYYLLMQRSVGGEIIGFEDFIWLEYSKAARKLSLKRERDIFREGHKILKKWERERRKSRQSLL